MLSRGAVFGKDPAGEAFCVSNEEPVKNEDFWWTVEKIIAEACDPARVKSKLSFVYVPEGPLWMVGYASELCQKVWKGRVSLGKDIDMVRVCRVRESVGWRD